MHIQFDRLDRYTLALLYLAHERREPPLSAAGHDPDAIQRLEQSGFVELHEDSDELELTQDGFARGKELCLRILDVDDIVDASWREDTWEPPEDSTAEKEILELSEAELGILYDGLDDHSVAYLDTQTGEVESFMYIPPEEMVVESRYEDEATPAERRRQLESDDRYIVIPDETTDEAWQLRRDYCDRIVDDDLRQQLLDNIHGSGAFSRFKDFIAAHPPLRELWFEYRTYRRQHRVLDLLTAHGYIPRVT